MLVIGVTSSPADEAAVLKRPFSPRGRRAVPVIRSWLLSGSAPDIQRSICAHDARRSGTLLMVRAASRATPTRRNVVECFAGALGVFALMTLAYAIIPHEWLTFANAYAPVGRHTQVRLHEHRGHPRLVPVD
jgi:hypothetical protein